MKKLLKTSKSIILNQNKNTLLFLKSKITHHSTNKKIVPKKTINPNYNLKLMAKYLSFILLKMKKKIKNIDITKELSIYMYTFKLDKPHNKMLI